MRPSSRRRGTAPLACALAACLGAGGCSFYLVKPPPPRDEWPDRSPDQHYAQARCTSHLLPAMFDTVIAGTAGTVSYLERNSGSPVFTTGIALAGIPVLASAVYGYIQTARCRSYRDQFVLAP